MKTSNGHDTFSNKRNFGLPCRMCAPCARPPNNAINYQSCPDDSWRRHSRLIARGRAVYIMVALPQPTKSRTATSENCHTASKRRALAVWLTASLFVLLRKHRRAHQVSSSIRRRNHAQTIPCHRIIIMHPMGVYGLWIHVLFAL